MTKNKRIILFAGIGCLVVAVLCVVGTIAIIGLSAGGALALSQPVADVGDAFMGALRDGDYSKAYTLASPQLQRDMVNPQALQFMIENQKIKPIRWTFSSRNIANDTGTLEGSATLSGGEGTAKLTLVKVGDKWQVRNAVLKLK